jgi:hypothetical protein
MTKFSVYIGIDWANDKHDVCVQVANSSTRKFEVIKHSPKSINEWISSLHKQYKGQIAVAIELSKGPIVYALQKFDFVTIHPVNTSMLAQYRKAFSPSGAKDDPTDAELALDLMLRYPNKIKALKMESESVRKLTYLVEQRRKLVDDKRRFSNRLIITLKEYYPHLLDWFSHRGSGIFCDFITRWPNLQKLKRARLDTLKKFFGSYPGRTAAYSVKRIQSISEAEPLTLDNAVIESHQLLAVALANQLLVAVKVIKVFDREISELFNALPDAELYNSLPGTGPCLAPRLLVAIGENRSRFNSASEIQMYAGIAPVTVRSGQKSWIHWRYQCSKFTRQSFIEWATKSIRQSYWAEIYYQQQREKGNTHQAAVRSLAFKWIRIVFRCWKTKEPYNEAKYLKALSDRNSPLLFKEKAC